MRCPDCDNRMLPETNTITGDSWYCTNCDKHYRLEYYNEDRAGWKKMSRCKYCLKEKTEGDCRKIDIRKNPYSDWEYRGYVCFDCRKSLKGLWRYHKEKEAD